jgi:RNA polymerase sigma-70 factor, ECF subfamily
MLIIFAMSETAGEITQLLQALRSGSAGAEDRLVEAIYPHLRRIAQGHMRRERGDHTLQPTALIHEAYLRLAGKDVDWQSRAHFFGVAAQVMRQILVDYARQRRAEKRGGGVQKVNIDDVNFGAGEPWEKMLALDQALSRLSEWDARIGRVVELRFFGGLSEEETAQVTGTSVRTVKRDWSLARAWLHSEIGK